MLCYSFARLGSSCCSGREKGVNSIVCRLLSRCVVSVPVRHPRGHAMVTRWSRDHGALWCVMVLRGALHGAGRPSGISLSVKEEGRAFARITALHTICNRCVNGVLYDATRSRMRSCHEYARGKRMFRGAILANSKSKCPATRRRHVPVHRRSGAICRQPTGIARQNHAVSQRENRRWGARRGCMMRRSGNPRCVLHHEPGNGRAHVSHLPRT
jgi:hypothetical protein